MFQPAPRGNGVSGDMRPPYRPYRPLEDCLMGLGVVGYGGGRKDPALGEDAPRHQDVVDADTGALEPEHG